MSIPKPCPRSRAGDCVEALGIYPNVWDKHDSPRDRDSLSQTESAGRFVPNSLDSIPKSMEKGVRTSLVPNAVARQYTQNPNHKTLTTYLRGSIPKPKPWAVLALCTNLVSCTKLSMLTPEGGGTGGRGRKLAQPDLSGNSFGNKGSFVTLGFRKYSAEICLPKPESSNSSLEK